MANGHQPFLLAVTKLEPRVAPRHLSWPSKISYYFCVVHFRFPTAFLADEDMSRVRFFMLEAAWAAAEAATALAAE